MKQLIREHIRRKVRQLVEEREYQLRQLSPGAYDALGPGTLGIPPSAIIDVKIISHFIYIYLDSRTFFMFIYRQYSNNKRNSESKTNTLRGFF